MGDCSFGMWFLKVLLLGIITCCNAFKPAMPVVRPNIATFNVNGSITGTILPGFRTPFIEAFLGVPFAEPPLGDLRFSNPVPFRDFWSHDHVANEEKIMCIQKNYMDPRGNPGIEGDEDCLYLNVFRPMGTASDKLLPVIIKIHGGAFIVGSPSTLMYGPKFFMDQGDVILVTPTYRVGPIGFLSTGDDEIPGNFAFKDQALAMQWVKDNIILFNGDPNQITIFGQSAGGASVHLHMMSPLSRDLFNRVVAASGCGIAPSVYVNDDPLTLTRQLAREVGILNYDTLTTAELAGEFRVIDPHVILNAGDSFHGWANHPIVVFKAVVENVDSPNAFLVEDPRVSIANGNYKKVPLLMTIVPEEGIVRTGMVVVNDELIASMNNNFDLSIGLQNDLPQDDPELQSKIDQIVEFYFNGTRTIGSHNAQQYTDMISDRMYHYPHYSAYKFQSQTADLENPLYLLKFNYSGPFSFSLLYTLTAIDFGVVHTDDLLYLFDTRVFPLFSFDSVEAQLVTEMVDIYVNFALGRTPHEKSTICSFDATDPDKPCEYLYIGNSEDGIGYEVDTIAETDLDMVNFWRGIDKLF